MTLSSNRVILYYNGAISALTLFVQHPDAGVCTPCPLPVLSEILDADAEDMDYVAAEDSVSAIGKTMGLPADLLQAHADYRERVDTPGGVITVYLAGFKTLDPPHQLMADNGCKFKTLTELRNRPPAEMELLRRAYVLVMES